MVLKIPKEAAMVKEMHVKERKSKRGRGRGKNWENVSHEVVSFPTRFQFTPVSGKERSCNFLNSEQWFISVCFSYPRFSLHLTVGSSWLFEEHVLLNRALSERKSDNEFIKYLPREKKTNPSMIPEKYCWNR